MKITMIFLVLMCLLGTTLALAEDGDEDDKQGLSVGSKAPDFELKGTDGKTYKLSDFKGKSTVVVAWYPKALTSG